LGSEPIILAEWHGSKITAKVIPSTFFSRLYCSFASISLKAGK